MEAEVEKQFCPICETEVKPYARYPRYVCSDCSENPVSADNRPLSFSNTHLSGGFIARYSDTNEIYDSHICFIDGVKCWANEARFGGIVIQTMFAKDVKDQVAGGIIGLLVGDALGVPYEFHSAEDIPFEEQIEFEPPEYFRRSHAGVPAGTYSDDGAQALCLLASLIECGKFDADDFAKNIVAWFREDYMAIDEVFDVGVQTQRAILNLRKGMPPLEAGLAEEKNNGNGSLMRVLPLALWHKGSDGEIVRDAELQSCVTHRHLRSQICCALYCLWARGILHQDENAWENAVQKLSEIYKTDAEKTVELKLITHFDENHKITGSGYVVDSLMSAKYLCQFNSFEEIVRAAIKLGNDTDTTACIAGGIAGLKFGSNGIPQRWRDNLRGKEIYEPLLEKLLERF